MIRLPIEHAVIRRGPGDDDFVVLNPTNSAVLAYCTTEEEAQSVVAAFRMMAGLARTGSLGDLPELVRFDFASIIHRPMWK